MPLNAQQVRQLLTSDSAFIRESAVSWLVDQVERLDQELEELRKQFAEMAGGNND